ncbi:MAG: hypothetical protein NDP09_06515 [Crenarchaeota archaeon]|nr:hypothetical protein [Thermoproteota archaeon]
MLDLADFYKGFILEQRFGEAARKKKPLLYKLNGFSVLALRLKRASKTLLEDIEIIKAALKKMGEDGK